MNIPFYSKFPGKAVVYQKRGGGLMAFLDSARYFEKEGTGFYELKSYKSKFRAAGFDDFTPMTNGKFLILLYEYQRDMLVPIDVSGLAILYETKGGVPVICTARYVCEKGHYFEDPIESETDKKTWTGKKDTVIVKKMCPHCSTEKIFPLEKKDMRDVPKIKKIINLKSIEEDMAYWGQLRRQQAEARHTTENFLQKYMGFILVAIVFVFCIILFYMLTKSGNDNTQLVVNAMKDFLPTWKTLAPG